MGSSSAPFAWERTDLSEAALEALGAAVCVIDSEGRVARWNQAATALTGISADRIRGSIFLETLPLPSDIDEWKREFERISALPAPGRFESRWRIHDGLHLPLAFSCSAVRDRAGNVEYFVCNFTDSLSRRIIAERIEESRYMSRFLHDTISQDLIALSYNVSYLETAAKGEAALTHTRAAVDLVDRCCRYIRILSFMMSPPGSRACTDRRYRFHPGYGPSRSAVVALCRCAAVGRTRHPHPPETNDFGSSRESRRSDCS
jgi:PAS domain S-box-containing protein